mgnify:CR=1 FL=1
MQGELTVADAASSRYRGRISTEIVRTEQYSIVCFIESFIDTIE